MTSIHALSGDELTLLQTPAQGTILYLAGTETPPVIFACRVNGSLSSHDMVSVFDYDTVTTGAHGDILPGMTGWLGSAAGLYDLGQFRVRKAATSSKIYIGEGSEIDWAHANNKYVTIVDEMGIWAKHAHITSKVMKMDYDVAFSDQHVDFAPVPIMGPGVVLDVAEYPVTVTFPEAAHSWVFASSISAWLWTANAGSLSGSTTNDPTLTIDAYPTNGLIRVALKVTSAAGAHTTGYRYIRVYDADHRPVSTFDLVDLSGNFSDGGFSFSVTMYANAARSAIRDRAPITLFARDYYGSTQVSIGQAEGRENIVCMGFVDGESIVEDGKGGTVTFVVQGPQFWLNKISGFPVELELAIKTPTEWKSMPGLTVDRALWHLCHWRSTLTAVCDVHRSGDTRLAATVKTAPAALWSQIKDIANNYIFGAPGFDPYGRFFTSIEPQLTPEADRDFITIMEITSSDWTDVRKTNRSTSSALAMLSLSGNKVSASGGSSTYFSLSNGHIFKRFGKIETLNKLLASSQTQLNTLAGLYVGWRNDEYPNFEFKLKANNRMITLFPPQYLSVDIQSGDTPRGIVYTGNLIPRSITYQWNAKKGVLYPEITCEAETFAELNIKGDIPEENSGISVVTPPKPPVPPLPPVPPVILPPTLPNSNHPTDVVIVSDNFGVLYTATFDKDEPKWIEMNEGLLDTEYTTIGDIVRTPNGKLFIMCYGGDAYGYSKIYYADGLGEPWNLLLTADDRPGDSTSFGVFHGLGINPLADEEISVLGGVSYVYYLWHTLGRFMTGSSAGLAIESYQTTFFNTPAQILYTLAGWFIFANYIDGSIFGPYGTAGLFNTSDPRAGDEGTPARLALSLNYTWMFGASAGTQPIMYYWTNNASVGYGKTDGTTQSTSTDIFPSTRGGLAASPVGQRIMAGSGSLYTPYRSDDAGATWTSMAAIIPVGMSVWENCGDDYRWIYGGGTNLKLTTSFGETDSNFDKEGNLTYIAPLIAITHIRFIQ